MKEPILYLLEALACNGVLLAAYTILLERKAAFRWCRAYLLLSTAAAAVIPLLRIPVWPGKVLTAVPAVTAGEWETAAEILPDEAGTAFGPELLAGAFYLLGAAFLFALAAWQILRIRRLRHDAEISRQEGFTLIRTPRRIASFSFFGSVYVWQGIAERDLPPILAHETSHIRHRHSYERLAMECLKIALWWNPFVWIAARRLTEVEEFEADSDVLAGGYDMERYMHVLLQQLFGYSPEIANGLRNSLTKKRFKMMTTTTRSRHTLLRLAGTLPAVIGLLCAFSFTSRAAIFVLPEQTADPAPAASTPAADTPHTAPAAAETPAPAAAAQQPETTDEVISVRVILKGADKTITNEGTSGILVKEVNGDRGSVTDAQGIARLRVPAGTVLEALYPDYHTSTLVTDKRNSYLMILVPESEAAQSQPTLHLMTRDEDGVQQRPLYLVDGVEYPAINLLDATRIESVTILKDRQALDVYGERGRNGVVLITTRNAEPSSTKAPDPDEPFLLAETMPRFRDSNLNAFRTWVQTQVRYPAEAVGKNIQGRVVATFVIEKDGSLTNVDLLQSPDKLLSDEARRILESTPAGSWAPGMQQGTPVRIRYTLPIDFRLDKASEAPANAPQADSDKPYLVAETMPKFENGDLNDYRRWLQMQIRYPQEAMKKKIQGRVIATFIIEKDGSLTNIDLIQSPDKLLSDEARRVLESTPAGSWTPGMQKGAPVRIRYTLPIDFRIQGAASDDTPQPKSAGTMDEIVVVGFGTSPRP